ncbi:MAG: hypothetical protein A2898_04465 [Candidatus Kerfeldbacteria bacterium RIFCSPLOWO2_01_FULL_48_11]|uniref:Uncharacterized protein n=1 Tax=Candidatus Kerfeldbacteria bacterium RIFCSPLOWO2_01_FULL_48_11 TaxID=1798543 RepID=A0A1G2B2B3_9BACT|nr:MAG: hypothetical protein A2898_04465 [Candidatus Kerfeldbacteria bacterium RIFCSPLOWO2_01_FULL_48_11]HCJ52453.1 hypothetical protein [Candidatus Kerfeldbacteria bacterium]HCM68225.1 hypothetical protein [Candidatus Kerfeldbacteria bacterium]
MQTFAYYIKTSERQISLKLPWCFFVTGVMSDICRFLASRCRPNTLVISYGFTIPGWKPQEIIHTNQMRKFLYVYRTIQP